MPALSKIDHSHNSRSSDHLQCTIPVINIHLWFLWVQVAVQDAIMCLSSIGTHPLRAGESGVDHAWTAAKVALDALHLLCRDDGPDFRIMAPHNVHFLASQLKLLRQFASRKSSIEEVQR